MLDVSIETFAQNCLNPCGKSLDHNTVKLGSADVPRLYSVCKYLKLVFVTSDLPSLFIPASDSVTQVGSPVNNSLYSGVLANLIILNFIIKWSINSCASTSSIKPSFKSLSI